MGSLFEIAKVVFKSYVHCSNRSKYYILNTEGYSSKRDVALEEIEESRWGN